MPTGTSIVVSTRPAIRSCGSQAASYRLMICSPGSQRFQPFMPASSIPWLVMPFAAMPLMGTRVMHRSALGVSTAP